ncbi:hypothetical protein FQA39_LY17854 [Lamprigera yunnana]|nr:hypothetical protein FQA39_LY17854 [Lamprigera yunnana]
MTEPIYFILFLAIINAICVSSQSQFNFNEDFNNNNNNFNRQPTTPGPTTTTRASIRFTNCFEGCRQRTTPQYNPVCGSNGQSYNNMKLLQCANTCGLSVEFVSSGTCGPSPGGK